MTPQDREYVTAALVLVAFVLVLLVFLIGPGAFGATLVQPGTAGRKEVKHVRTYLLLTLAAGCSGAGSAVGDGGPVRSGPGVVPLTDTPFPSCTGGEVPRVECRTQDPAEICPWPCMGRGVGAHACALCATPSPSDAAPPACTVPPDPRYSNLQPPGCKDWLCVRSCDQCPSTAPAFCEVRP